jgi:ribosomal protein S18 acetylase RimI-like enzyme
MIDPTACFSWTHAEARATFLRACIDQGGAIVSHCHPLTGPDGEPLFLDAVRFGAPAARKVIFLASGTHGIEGFCGSGIQTFLLRSGVTGSLPDDVALVFLHAVNPWGFAWLRRVNEDNVDLNRNFIDHAAPHPENPEYAALDPLLNPGVLDDAAVAALLAATQRIADEQGMGALFRAVSGGQYDHPRGVQFGGRTPVWSNRMLRTLWANHAADADLAVFVDLHSGLGPAGFGLVMQTAATGSIAAQLACDWWPDTIRVEPAQGSDAALYSGLIGPAFTAVRGAAAAVGVVLEFGTIDMTRVMLAIQADNWLQHHGRRDSDAGRAIEQRMREAFFVETREWQEGVCARSRDVVDRALRGMAAFAPPVDAAAPRVRTATAADADVLVGFAQAMARETEDRDLDAAVLRAGVTALLEDPDRGRVFVVEIGGDVVATLMVTREWSEWRNGFFWWIQSVYVRADHRRTGLYRLLHAHVRALAAADPGVCGLRLYAERDNHAAQATYRALGMEELPYLLFEETTRPH